LLYRFLAIVIATGFLACGPSEPGGLDRDKFIDVIVELRKAAREYPDSATFDVHKTAILAEAGVTDSVLTEFIRIHNADTRYMAEIWETVDQRVNPTPGQAADTVR